MTADDYLRRVDFALRDLPWRARRELLAELREHLSELPAEAELGTPEEYAADLRSAAGLERRRGPIAFLRARRPRNLILTAAAVTAIGLAIGAVVWIDSYQPLSFGNGAQYPPATKGVVGSDVQQVEFRQGRPFEVGVSMVNTGRFTVRVLGSAPPEDPPVSARLFVAGPLPNHGQFEGPYRPFRPFDLGPGQLALLVLRGSYHASCHPNGRVQDFWELPGFSVRYGFLWRTGTAEIDLPSQLQIAGPKGMDCAGAQAVAGR